MNRIWMPLYIGDFLADTMELGATERGIYISLIMHAWQHDGLIPLDDKKLARISGCDSRLWHQYKETVLQFFDVVNDVSAQHSRVVSELHRCSEISNKRKAAALQKHSKSSAKIVHLDTQSQSQSQSQLYKKERKEEPPLRAGKHLIPADWRPSEVHFDLATRLGLSMKEVEEAAGEMRDWSLGNGERRSDWDRVFSNWLRRNSRRKRNGFGGPRTLQDDSKSVSRAADRLAERAERGEQIWGPRPSLLPAAGADIVQLLPKGRST